MFRIVLLISMMIVTMPVVCQDDSRMANWWEDYDGMLGDSEFQISLYFSSDKTITHGNYCLRKDEQKIQLTGHSIGDQVELTEYTNGRPSGFFRGRIFIDEGDWFEGVWTDITGKNSLKFKARMGSGYYGSTWNDRYQALSGEDEEVENFLKEVQKRILSRDKQWLSDYIQYPIMTRRNGKSKFKIQNKAQFIGNFDVVFYPEFQSRIKSLFMCNYFNNYQGAMLGAGLIWITDDPESSHPHKYQIMAINNSKD